MLDQSRGTPVFEATLVDTEYLRFRGV
ncbi:hypothetical protein NOCA2310061 [metagenome]|uniref:Uncharacterized protein n=1 Tax=metagenome TaxID=256318 RepID=A0A2P2C1K4_9ZZZZ